MFNTCKDNKDGYIYIFINAEMALFYSHAIFQKKVSSGSDSFSMAGFKF